MKLKNILKNKKILYSVILALVAIGVIVFFVTRKNSNTTLYAIFTVKTGNISETVNGTGQVSGQNQVNITPLSSGKITEVRVKQGDEVKEGQIIAIIDESSALASLNQAQSALETAKANYNKLIAGPTDLDIKAAELSLKQAQDTLHNSYINLLNSLNSIYINTFNNIHNNIDALFNNPNDVSVSLIYNSSDYQAQINAVNGKILTNNYLKQWQKELEELNFNSDPQEIEKSANNALFYLNSIKQFLTDTLNSLISAIPTSRIPQSSIDGYKSNVSSALSSVQQNISSLVSSLQQIQSSKNSVEQAKLNLEKLKTPPTEAEIQSAKTAILNAETQLKNAQTNYDNNIIRAPFSGEIAVLNIQKGSLITGSTVAGTTGSTVIGTIVAKQKIAQISLNEIDVAKIKVGDKAILTFDAFPNKNVEGKVAEIEGVGTVTQGVVNYNVKIIFDPKDLPIRSGMSVSANIITQTKENVLLVPNEAIKNQGGKNYVQVLDKNNITPSPSNKMLFKSISLPQRVFIKTGIADDKYTEIIEGLKEGDIVVIREISSSNTNSSTQSGGRNQNINFRAFRLP